MNKIKAELNKISKLLKAEIDPKWVKLFGIIKDDIKATSSFTLEDIYKDTTKIGNNASYLKNPKMYPHSSKDVEKYIGEIKSGVASLKKNYAKHQKQMKDLDKIVQGIFKNA